MISEYIKFRKLCDGIEIREDEVDFEDLISYLDIEHFLRLRGSDTWSRDGNKTQVSVIGLNKPSTLMFEVPSGLTSGDYTVMVCNKPASKLISGELQYTVSVA